MTNDNSSNQSFSGNATNSIVSVGNNNTFTNTITQLPTENTELKDLLSQLQSLINDSPLSDTTKQKALGKAQTIAEAVEKPEAEQQTLVQKTIGYFDGLADSLEGVPETALKLGGIINKISLLFGV